MDRSILLLLALVAGGCGSAPPAAAPLVPPPPAVSSERVERVDGKAARVLVKEGARLLDVRTPREYADKHVDGAENVPVDTISSAELGPKDKAVVVYCGSGARSKRAAEALRARGYTRIYDLGAISRWDE